MKNSFLARLPGVFLLMYCASLVAGILSQPHLYQGDFYGYYLCAKAYALGLNPYDARVTEIAIFPYVYTPFSLSFFRIFTYFNYDTAFLLFLALKSALIAGLIYLWRNKFLDRKTGLLFYLFCLFAFNSTFYIDLKTGNISLIEQCMLWLAFFCFLKRRLLYFCIFVMAAAMFKIQPILFLFLLGLSDDRNKGWYLAGSLTAFGMLLLLQWALSPELFSGFIANAIHTNREGDIINPSTFTFIRDLCGQFFAFSNVSRLNKVALTIHGAAACAILCVSWPVFTRMKALSNEDKNKWVLFFACLCYALINIRFKDYSYILLIMPAYFIIDTLPEIPRVLLLLIASIPAARMALSGTSVLRLFWSYYPLLVAYLVWGLYLNKLSYVGASEAQKSSKIKESDPES